MHALIPLLLIFILLNSHQLKVDKLYRANIFSLVGISYFLLYQYILYWYQIFPTEGVYQFIPGLLIFSSTVLIALSSWNRQSHPTKTVALCTLCTIALIATFTFDRAIKESLAELGGFFSGESIVPQGAPTEAILNTIEIPGIGIQLEVPNHWSTHTLPSGHTYFTAEDNERLMLEVRPNCMQGLNTDTPTFINNTLLLFKAPESAVDHRVRCVNASQKECLVTVIYNGPKPELEKWRWFKVAEDESYSVMMDVIFMTTDNVLKEDILYLLKSTKLLNNGPTEYCRTPASWL